MFSTPILFLIFNRPETTERVFDEISKQKPKYLYIAADGPRENNIQDIELCKRSREIVHKIDWDCEVKTLFREHNLGCGVAPAEAITWFFEDVEQGIILEDDILTDPSFFFFCEEMLNQYRDDESIMHISGSYFLDSLLVHKPDQSYYFTKHIHVWGWATWRRAWKYYDYNMGDWPAFNSDEQLKTYYGDYYIFWKKIFSRMEHKGNDIWDYQWMFAIYKRSAKAINPTKNLTKNIGFGHNATHTTNTETAFTKISLASISKITAPLNNGITAENDALYYKNYLDFDLQFEHAKTKLSWKLKNNFKRLRKRFQAFFR